LRTPLTATAASGRHPGRFPRCSENEKRRHELRRGILRATRLNDHLLALARGQQMRELTAGRIDLDAAIIEIFGFLFAAGRSRNPLKLHTT